MISLFPVTFVGLEQIVNKLRVHRKSIFAAKAGQGVQKQRSRRKRK